jgi:hypothetical protein
MSADLVPHAIKIEFNALQNGVPVVNRVYVTQSGTISSADLDDVGIKALAFFNNYKTVLHASYVLSNITITDVSIVGGSQLIIPLTTANTGLVSGAVMAANAAVVTSLRSARIGRSFRGRWYWGGLPEASMSDAQNITSGAATAFNGVMQDFIDQLLTIGKVLVVVSRFADKVARTVALTTDIIGLITDTKIDSQRRRTAN